MSGDGARISSAPLPEARALRRAVESLGARVAGGRPGRALDRDDAAQLAGMLHGLTELYEAGLRGTPAQTQFQKGWLATYDHDARRVLAQLAAQLRDTAEFANAGVERHGEAHVQLRVASLALLCASWAAAAAAQIVGHDGDRDLAVAGKYSGHMVDAAGGLHRFVQALEDMAQEHYARRGEDGAADVGP